jgi:hypothetical protein
MGRMSNVYMHAAIAKILDVVSFQGPITGAIQRLSSGASEVRPS